MKKVFAALLLVVVTCGFASAAEILLNGNVAGGHINGDWNNAAHWFIHPNPAGRIPAAGDNAAIDRGWDGLSATLDAGSHDINNLTIAYHYKNNDLTIGAGVDVNLTGNLLIGGSTTGDGTLHNSGDIAAGYAGLDREVIVGAYGNGTLNMNGGSIKATYFKAPSYHATNANAPHQTTAHVQLDGGTITAWDWALLSGNGEKNGTMDITSGVLQGTRGDMATRAQTYIDNGWLTAYGGTGIVDIDTSGASGYAVRITGIVPEPTSLVLLSLASLALVVRRRK